MSARSPLKTKPTSKSGTKPSARRPTKSSYINARVEPKLKKSAEAVLDKIGMTTTDAVTLFLTQVVAHRGMPFPVRIPNRETIKAMRDIEAGRTESFAGSAQELFDHILGKNAADPRRAMKKLNHTGSFKRDLKRVTKRGYDLTKLASVLTQLQTNTPLASSHRPHPLKGEWKGFLECHIGPNWLLIYQVQDTRIILARTGTHSDLFDE